MNRFIKKSDLWTAITTICISLLVWLTIDDIAMESQQWFSLTLFTVALLLWLCKGRESFRVTLFVLSAIASFRYIYWRGTQTLNLTNFTDSIISLLLFAAELYAVAIFVLNFFQVLYLDRSPTLVEADPQYIPTVDIFIPTFNESIDILKRTVCGAQGIKYLNKTVYLLDDGRRPEVKKLSVELGCKYITRSDNSHAKAGNINNALAHTNGEFILVFDADHIPTGSFLERTIHFFKDKDVALVQTPHRFVNPGPIERNLYLDDKLPKEQELFYQMVQIGNHRWNAAFFCGSAAILRRSALDKIGGIATETITEDCHTSMKLHANGWKSVYVSTPLSVGLSPESFRAHLIQRCRWAQGMVQILRLDNPLFLKGLSWQQRVCYLSSMGHFFFGLPRLIFILTPLAYLMLGLYPFIAAPFALIVMVVPHLTLATFATNYQYRNIRHSFWSEIYESLLAPYVAMVTVYTLMRPRKGRFQVTPKGGMTTGLTYSFADAWPLVVIALATILGLAFCPIRYFQAHGLLEKQVLLINSFWTFCNFIVVFTAALVAVERPFSGRAHRVQKKMPVSITSHEHPEVLSGTTVNINEFDTLIELTTPVPSGQYFIGQKLELAFVRPHQKGVELKVEGAVRRILGNRQEIEFLALEFINVSSDKSISLIHLSYSDQHTWGEFHEPPDSIIYSYWNLLTSPWRVFWNTLMYYSKLPSTKLKQ